MKVLVVEPGFHPYEDEINGLSEMQEVVGGHIQAIYPFQEAVALVCNENGISETVMVEFCHSSYVLRVAVTGI